MDDIIDNSSLSHEDEGYSIISGINSTCNVSTSIQSPTSAPCQELADVTSSLLISEEDHKRYEILFNAGYNPSVINDALKTMNKPTPDIDLTESKKTLPNTRIFTQGKVYTYEKLTTQDSSSLLRKTKTVTTAPLGGNSSGGLSKTPPPSCLNPNTPSFIPSTDQNAILFLKKSELKI